MAKGESKLSRANTMKILRTALYCIALSCAVAFSLPLTAEQLDPAPTPEQAKRAAEVEALINARRAAMREELEKRRAAQEANEKQEAAVDPAIQAQIDAAQKARDRQISLQIHDEFGAAVSIHGDTALVGATLDAVDDRKGQGSAYVYARKGERWLRQARLLAQDGGASDYFGESVAIFGDTALIGASKGNGKRGCAYVFKMKNGQWRQEAKLIASDGMVDDSFGASVALFGDTALVGAWLDDVGTGVDQGSVYVFQREGKTWLFQEKLAASKDMMHSAFGFSVSLSGNTALIGRRLDTDSRNLSQISAYVFQRSGRHWVEQAKLAPSHATPNQGAVTVAIDGDFAVLGARQHGIGNQQNQGAAYVFQRRGNTWTEQATLRASDGAQGDQFGSTVAVSGRSILVGAPMHGGVKGSAYLFALANEASGKLLGQDGQRWAQRAKLVAQDGAIGDGFAGSVSLSGNSALIGAPLRYIGGNTLEGSAYVLVDDGKNWLEQAKFTLKDGSK
jgi:hypothetical protein